MSLEKKLYKFGARSRYLWLLSLVRIITEPKQLRRYRKYWSPNVIRKNISHQFTPLMWTFKGDGYVLDLDINDYAGFLIFMARQPYDLTALKIAKKLDLGTEHILLDIGAHLGTVTVPVCATLGCESVAVEASKATASHLLRNLFLNNLKSRVFVRALVAPEETRPFIPFYRREGNTGANSIKEGWSPSRIATPTEWVTPDTLDNLVPLELAPRIGLVKVDVEGAEEDVIRGGRSLLAHCDAPIILEYKAKAVTRFLGKNTGELVDLLRETHEIYALGPDLSLCEFVQTESYENILALPLRQKDALLAKLT